MAGATHKVHRANLPAGDRGVDITVGLMMNLIRRGARHPAIKKIVAGLDRSTPLTATRAAFMTVLERIRYQYDPDDEELVRAAWVTLTGRDPVGDCDCMTVALGAELKAMGIPCWVRVIDWRPEVDEFTHVYMLAEALPGIAIPLDPVMGIAGFGNERWPLKRTKEYKV